MRRSRLLVVAFAMIALACCASTSRAGTTRHQLDTVLPELRFDGVALGDAIDFVRDISGANINVNWKTLEEAGVTKDTPLNIRMRSITLRKALNLMLTQASGGTGGAGAIGFTLDQGVIEITTQEKIDAITYTRVYPVEDLIMEIPDFNDAPNFDLNATSSNSSTGSGGGAAGGGGGGGNTLFNTSSTGAGTGDDKGKTKAERAQDLIDLIKTLIQPDIWDTGKAAIRFFNGSLVVTAPRSVQEAIGGPFD